MKDAAHYSIKHVKVEFVDNTSKDDFITERQFNSFVERAKDLGIEVKVKSTKCIKEREAIGLLDRLFKW